ncbi:uncharacterized protein [Palaemon carinicauda]|uniref:uncharacterized protein n=1 Tax=Palaemon carinicauda TaxID=392227 RepID=UPI0035B60947
MKLNEVSTVHHGKTMSLLMVILFTPMSSHTQKVYSNRRGTAARSSESSRELIVSLNSRNCKHHVEKVECFYNETDKLVVVPSEIMLPDLVPELQIKQAKSVHIYPNCVPWITAIGVRRLNTMPQKGLLSDQAHCGFWLQIYRSKANLISHGLRHLSVIDSNVNTLKLKHLENFSVANSSIESIEGVSWEGTVSYIKNSTIIEASNMVCRTNWTVSDSHIDIVNSDGIIFEGSALFLINTVITQIGFHGIRISTGAALFTNVVIDKVESSGIILVNPSAHLVLTNVTVNSAQISFIKALDKSKISIHNVTVNGTTLDVMSEFLEFEDEFFPLDTSSEVEEKGKSCIFDITRIVCDFSLFNETLVFHADASDRYAEIKNAGSLEILTVFCNLELHLVNVTAVFPQPLSGYNLDFNDCNLTITISHSTLKELSIEYVSTLTLINTTCELLHNTVVNDLIIEESTVFKAYNLNITGSRSKWNGFHVLSTYNITLSGPVEANDIPILGTLKKESLVIDHFNATTDISKLRILTLSSKAIWIRQGSLVIRDFETLVLFEGAIYVEEGASLDIHFGKDPLILHASISVANKDQVTLKGLSKRSEATVLHIRNLAAWPTDEGSNFTVSDVHQSPFCKSSRSFILAVIECDFSSVPEAVVKVDIKNSVGFTVEVSSAALVKLYPSCVSKVVLANVTKATTVDSEDACETWLEAVGVSFDNITSGVRDIALRNCSVELFSLDRALRDVDLEDTHVEMMIGIHWTEYEGIFNNSYLGTLEDIIVSSHMKMLDTTINQIQPRGITVLGHGVISGCNINKIGPEGITVLGKLRIENTTVGNISKRGIVVQDGILFLSNVNIALSEELSIVATENGAVAMKNVSVAGKRIYWHGYIADSLKMHEYSVIFLNKFAEEDHNVSSIFKESPFDSSHSEISQINPTVSIVSSLSKTATITVDGYSSDAPAEVTSLQLSWKNATLILAAISLLLIGCCALLMIKLIKLSKVPVFSMAFWKKKDECITLLREEQPPSNPAGSSCDG